MLIERANNTDLAEELLLNERQLLRRIAEGDQDAFSEVFDHYQGRLYTFSRADWGGGLNTPVLRYADILLLHAEAIMNQNGGGPTNRTVGIAEAAISFNLVRERAGLDPIAAPTFNDLMYERRMELAFEGGDRHFDLVRWGLAEEIYNNLPAEGTYKPKRVFNPEVHRILPFPQNEIDISNGSLEQSFGYQP